MAPRWRSFLLMLVSSAAFVFLAVDQGSAGIVGTMTLGSSEEHPGIVSADQGAEGAVAAAKEGREMAEMAIISAVDYAEPGANTNPRAGNLWGAPRPPPPPPPPPAWSIRGKH